MREISNFKPLTECLAYKNNQTIRSYQLEGLNWLLFSWFSKRNCILADEMGLGKTIQALATLDYLKNKCHVGGPFLVVAPLATLRNWQREIESWTSLNAVIYSGTTTSREVIKRYEFRFRDHRVHCFFS